MLDFFIRLWIVLILVATGQCFTIVAYLEFAKGGAGGLGPEVPSGVQGPKAAGPHWGLSSPISIPPGIMGPENEVSQKLMHNN